VKKGSLRIVQLATHSTLSVYNSCPPASYNVRTCGKLPGSLVFLAVLSPSASASTFN